MIDNRPTLLIFAFLYMYRQPFVCKGFVQMSLSSLYVWLWFALWIIALLIKKGSPVCVAPTCAGSGKWSNHFGSYVCSIFLHFCKMLFPGLEPMTSWSQGNSFTTAPGLPLNCIAYKWSYFVVLHLMHHMDFPFVGVYQTSNSFCLEKIS
jgi:hypothetical protein